MKKALTSMVMLAFAFVAVLGIQPQLAVAADTTTFEVTGEYGQTEARSMLKMVNDFRTGAYVDGGQSSVWAKASDGSIDTASYQGLSELQYDYELERIAMQRAMETVLQKGHTRPTYAADTNSNSCFELVPSNYTASGENLAYGYGGANATAQEAFESWCETNYGYSGQGHRRNMLGRGFNRVGIAHVVIHWSGTLDEGDRPYGYETDVHYWVQEFGYCSDSTGLTATEACDTNAIRNVEVLKSNIEKVKLSANADSLSLVYGESRSMEDDVVSSVRLQGTWPDEFALSWSDGPVSKGTYTVPVKGDFAITSQDSSVAGAKGKTITANGVGTTTVRMTSSLDSTAAVDLSVTVEPAPLDSASVVFPQQKLTYTGSPQEPAPAVQLGGKTLVKEQDYDVLYTDNQDVGTANVSIVGKGNYAGTATATFEITAKDLGSADVQVADIAPVVYNGADHTPTPAIAFNGTALQAGSDFTVEYDNNVNAGTATATITGKGNFTGTVVKQFAITPKTLDASMVSLDTESFEYNALAQAPRVTVADPNARIAESDYEVAMPDAVNRGTYQLVVTGKGNYTGTVEKGFEITPKQLEVDMIGFDTESFTYTGSTQKPQVVVKNGDAELTSADYTVTNAGGTDAGRYPVEITAVDGGNYSGSVVKEFVIAPASLENATVTVDSSEGLVYTGAALEPKCRVELDGTELLLDADFDVKYANNKNAGTATVTVTGKGNYTGSAQGEFVIAPKPLASDMLASIDSVVYKGAAWEPTVSVADDGQALKAGSDYEVSFANNADAGTANVAVTGKGNYTGTLETSFEIAKAPLTAVYVDESIDMADAPALKVAYEGFVGGEDASALDVEPQVVAPEDLQVGTYKLEPANGAAENYEFTYASGTLTVVDKAADVLAELEGVLASEPTAASVDRIAAVQQKLADLTPAQVQRLETLKANSLLAGKDLDVQLAAAATKAAELAEADARTAAVATANKAISTAQNAKKGILTASKATTVAYNKKWTTAAEAKKLNAALTALQRAVANTEATSTDITAATSKLTAATAAYKKAVKKGSKNTGTIKTASKKLKWSKLKKKAQSFKLAKKGVAEKAKVTWKKLKGSSKVKVNAKTGKVTVAKKGIKKGKTVKITVQMTMAKTKNCTKTVVKKIIKIKVK